MFLPLKQIEHHRQEAGKLKWKSATWSPELARYWIHGKTAASEQAGGGILGPDFQKSPVSLRDDLKKNRTIRTAGHWVIATSRTLSLGVCLESSHFKQERKKCHFNKASYFGAEYINKNTLTSKETHPAFVKHCEVAYFSLLSVQEIIMIYFDNLDKIPIW